MPSPYTEEHQMFRQQVRAFAQNELAPHADEWEASEAFPRWVFEKAGELGILGAHFDEDVGGGGGDYWFSIAKAEELPHCNAAGVALALLVQSDMATPVIHDLGTPEQKEEFLKPAVLGQKIAALGVTEPGAGSDVSAIRTTAKRVGDDYVINGSKTFITNGTVADFVTLLVKTDPDAGYGGISIIIFPTDTKGFEVSKKLKKVGNWSSDTAEIFFDDCRVPARNLLGAEGQGFYYLMQNFQSERLIGAASAAAGAKLAIDRSIEYGRQRKAFGKPIIKREVWQHRFVDMLTQLEAGKQLTYAAAEAYNREKYVDKTQLSMETTKLISMSKLYVGELVSHIMDECMQFHGGMGYLEELWVARAWRDQRLMRIGGGTSEVMRYLLAKVMGL